ncbi:hemopexin repeat-containing protein, partial [Kibdelosporangium lantanae]
MTRVLVVDDQDLVGKFPEPLVLPPGLDRFDALLDSVDGNIYVFHGDHYWTYTAATYAMADPDPQPLTKLSTRFANLASVDAAFRDHGGAEWILGRTTDSRPRVFVKDAGTTLWVERQVSWGTVRNNFTAPAQIDAAHTDRDGRVHLFRGDQYIRYSGGDYSHVDEGFPRPITDWWESAETGG